MWSVRRRPDFGIRLPAGRKYIYLELKTVAWGSGYRHYYQGAIDDIKKLDADTEPQNQRNGLIALGLSRKREKRSGQLREGFKKLSQKITNDYPYEEIGLERVYLQEMDKQSSYAVIGLWFRKSSQPQLQRWGAESD